jgi:hypothetical protein
VAAKAKIKQLGTKTISNFLFGMGMLTMLLLLVFYQLSIQANLNPAPVLWHPGLVVILFLVSVTGLLVWMGLRMRKLEALLPSRELPAGIWFPAKRWGWGWGPPVRWQGWAFMVIWLAALLAGALALLPGEPTAGRIILLLAFLTAMSAIMIAVCWIKGEKPRWRWGA